MWPLGLLTLLCCLSRLAAIQGPGSVRGYLGGSLTATCYYGTEYESYGKWWCRGANWNFCGILVETNGTEQAVKKDRLTIRDSHSQRRFTVTMERLSFNDIDTYWCGIARSGTDLGVQVKVSVVPEPTTSATRIATTTKTNINEQTIPVTLKVSMSPPNVTHHLNETRSLLNNIHFLIHVFLEVPLLLGMVGLVLWVSRPQRSLRNCPENQWPPITEHQGTAQTGCQAKL